MSRRSIFAGQSFGPVLGRQVPIRRSLGFTPTGALPPVGCTPLGTRMIEDQSGYTPIGCPTGPDCYDIIDAVTGTVVIKGVQGLIGGAEVNHKAVGACLQYGYTYGQEQAPSLPSAPQPLPVEHPPVSAPGPSTTVLPGPASQFQQPCNAPRRISGPGFFGGSQFG